VAVAHTFNLRQSCNASFSLRVLALILATAAYYVYNCRDLHLFSIDSFLIYKMDMAMYLCHRAGVEVYKGNASNTLSIATWQKAHIHYTY
jgi:hypothetical protein